ncbi:hypothetical protein Tco_0621188, partial [Tanacetum coccineum]
FDSGSVGDSLSSIGSILFEPSKATPNIMLSSNADEDTVGPTLKVLTSGVNFGLRFVTWSEDVVTGVNFGLGYTTD